MMIHKIHRKNNMPQQTITIQTAPIKILTPTLTPIPIPIPTQTAIQIPTTAGQTMSKPAKILMNVPQTSFALPNIAR